MEIRKFKTEDAIKVSTIIKNNYRKINLGGHSKEGIRLQIEGNSPINLIERSKTIHYYVATEKDKIIGICGYDKKKIHTLFVNINYHKKGIGKKLLTKVLFKAKKEGIKSLLTLSTFYAEKFYKSFGFKRIKEIAIPPETKDIILIEMKKMLDEELNSI